MGLRLLSARTCPVVATGSRAGRAGGRESVRECEAFCVDHAGVGVCRTALLPGWGIRAPSGAGVLRILWEGAPQPARAGGPTALRPAERRPPCPGRLFRVAHKAGTSDPGPGRLPSPEHCPRHHSLPPSVNHLPPHPGGPALESLF